MSSSSLPPLPPGAGVAVAYSGGLDSTALLHAATRTGARVVACHVHHGLQPVADVWAQQAEVTAKALGAEFALARLNGSPAPGESIEAWARAGRHQALHDLARAAGVDLLLLAHHRRDQAETFVLQALRGAGMAGLAAMPRLQWRDGLCWARPWLDQPRERILAYAMAHGLNWIEDPSNADARFARNRLRQVLWPAFPEGDAGLAQSARWAAEANALAADVAAEDLQRLSRAGCLDLAALQTLSLPRRRNALRHWLTAQLGTVPASLVDRLMAESRPGATQTWPAPGARLHAYRDRLYVEPALPVPVGTVAIDLSRPGRYPQPPWRGAWVVEAAAHGVPAAVLSTLTQRPRAEGDQFQRAAASVARRIKKAAQQAGLPPWRRDGPVLVDADGRLVAMAGLGMDARAFAGGDEPQRVLRWVEDSALLQSEGDPRDGA